MPLSPTQVAIGLVLAAAGSAQAAPTVEIRHAVARVVVIPGIRSGISVAFLKTSKRLPLRVIRVGRRLVIEGDTGHRIGACRTVLGQPAVSVRGRGEIAWRDMPQIVIYTPMDARVSVGEAVFGSIGRSDSLAFSNSGCGDWTIANVRGHLRLSQAGAGDTRTGAAGSADLSVAGSGVVETRAIRDGLEAVSSGAGDIAAEQVSGPLNVRIAGSGDIRAPTGQVTRMTADVAGSGDVRFGGVAQSLNASVAGTGGVIVAQVTGPVRKRVFGSGGVRVGR
ncbi:MAG TPA: DUF2807 domain-containing protein [Caulobacteraceae bacterium]